jgi:hypothetical protein
MKQTAVEWLQEQLKINNYLSENAHWLIDEAKEMEKQQIITAYNKAVPFKFGKEYYNETFKNKK